MQQLAVDNPFGHAPVFYKPETDSTMNDAKNLARQGYPSGTIIIAGHQTSGRGRFADRRWYSPPETSLAFTLLLRDETVEATDTGGTISLRAGLGVADAIRRHFELPCHIKWPNDVLVEERKLAGILCERRPGESYVGIGVNCNDKRIPSELRSHATSLRRATGRRVPPLDFFALLLPHLHGSLSAKDWRVRLEALLYQRDTTVLFRRPDGIDQEVVVKGVTEEGYLLVFPVDGEGPQTYASGEIVGSPKTGRRRRG